MLLARYAFELIELNGDDLIRKSSDRRSSSSAYADDPVMTERRIWDAFAQTADRDYWMPRLKRGHDNREIGDGGLS